MKFAALLDDFDPPTKRDAFARVPPTFEDSRVERVLKDAQDACHEAASRFARAEALFDQADRLLK